MNALGAARETLVSILYECASRWTGFRRDAFKAGALERFVKDAEKNGEDLLELQEKALKGSLDLILRLAAAVPVGETYFFRQPGQFHFLGEKVLPLLGRKDLKVWSAGCATGEEAYSLAAFLSEPSLRGKAKVRVLGTDLSPTHLETARRGRYRSWSIREGAEAFLSLLDLQKTPEGHQVPDRIKRLVRFKGQNLLQALPKSEGIFDIIFCRNVLIYFTPEASSLVIQHLVRSLAKKGFLFLGPMDLTQVPPGLQRVGPVEWMVFQKEGARSPQVRPDVTLPMRTYPTPQKGPKATGAQALHLRALEAIEKEDAGAAFEYLTQLQKTHPSYLPGLQELALWNARHNRRHVARGLMEELLRRLSGRNDSEAVPGPQPLTVGFYRLSAKTFLEKEGRRGKA